MIDIIFSAAIEVLSWPTIGYLFGGIAIGFIVGLLPGLGGAVTLALMLPFVFGLEPIAAFALLVGMFATTSNTGELTSILFGVPGEGTTAASILDGHPMAMRGEAGRAMGASLASSAVGALIGVVAVGAFITGAKIASRVMCGAGSDFDFFNLTLPGSQCPVRRNQYPLPR